MLCKEIIERIEEAFPREYAMEWDNVGLLAGRDNKEVGRIYIAVDPSDEVVEHAVQEKADMLITHHPLIFSPVKKITNEHFIGRRIVRLLQNDISYCAIHTNYDVLRMAELAAERLPLRVEETLNVTAVRDGEEKGIGNIGFLEAETTLSDCYEQVKRRFGLPSVKVFGDRDTPVWRAAVLPGSGKSGISAAIEKGADVLITGDIGHQEGIDALAQGLCIIDAGHYGLEHIFMEDMKAFLERTCAPVTCMTEAVKFPFYIWE